MDNSTHTIVNDRIDNIHETLNSVYEKMGKMEARLKDIHEEVKKTNGRVTILEQWKWKTVGILSLIMFVATLFKDQIINYFN